MHFLLTHRDVEQIVVAFERPSKLGTAGAIDDEMDAP